MPNVPRRLTLLEKKLASLPSGDAMLVSELDGFVAGLLVCPDLILPSEWLPLVWGSDEDADPVFENAQQAEQLVKLVMEHYNATAHDLQAGRFAPVFEVDTRHDEVLWELWIEGFETAMQLRPDSWGAMLRGAEAVRVALSGMIMLSDLAQGDSTLTESEAQDLTEQAPDLIPAWVETLHAWRVGQQGVSLSARPSPTFGKVGRNDPCPCGSGKKYKKCCGLN